MSWTNTLLAGLTILANLLAGLGAWLFSEPKLIKQPGRHSLEMRDGETTKLTDAPRPVGEVDHGHHRLRIPPYMR